jgi:hypothetical protein
MHESEQQKATGHPPCKSEQSYSLYKHFSELRTLMTHSRMMLLRGGRKMNLQLSRRQETGPALMQRSEIWSGGGIGNGV